MQQIIILYKRILAQSFHVSKYRYLRNYNEK